MSLSQVSSCLSDPREHGLGVLLPHLAGVAVDGVEVAGLRLFVWARARAERAVCPHAASCRAGCTAVMSGGWPMRRSVAGRW